MIKLDSRLNCIALLADNCEIFWDVGSDHGYLPIALLQQGKIKKAYLSDINQGPLNKSIENAKRYNLSEKITTILCSGLEANEEINADNIAICGMGGELIADILKKGDKKARKAKALILQPMSAADELRKYLYNNNFKIIDEDIVKDKHLFYNIIKAVPKKDTEVYKDIYFELGYIPLKKKLPLYKEFILKKIEIEEKIISSLNTKKTDRTKAQLSLSQKRINELREVLKEYES